VKDDNALEIGNDDIVHFLMVRMREIFIACLAARKLLSRGAGRIGPGRGAGTGCEGRRKDEFGMTNDEWRT